MSRIGVLTLCLCIACIIVIGYIRPEMLHLYHGHAIVDDDLPPCFQILVTRDLEPMTTSLQRQDKHAYIMPRAKRDMYWREGRFPNHLPQGWIEAPSADIVAWVHSVQQRRDMWGSIGEIGVHHGKFFLALASVARRGEVLWANDLFESLQAQNIDGSGKGSRRAFNQALQRYGIDVNAHDVRIVTKSSTTLTNDDFHNVPCFRLFSIDGGHTNVLTYNDLCVAQRILCPGGVVTIDDFSNTLWPGVYTGYAQYTLGDASVPLVPFYWGHNKIWLTTRGHHGLYYNDMTKFAPSVARDTLFGWPVRQGAVHP